MLCTQICEKENVPVLFDGKCHLCSKYFVTIRQKCLKMLQTGLCVFFLLQQRRTRSITQTGNIFVRCSYTPRGGERAAAAAGLFVKQMIPNHTLWSVNKAVGEGREAHSTPVSRPLKKGKRKRGHKKKRKKPKNLLHIFGFLSI